MRYTKETADAFIRESKPLLVKGYRLNYHLMAEFGWMNDPNGFIQYRDQYHLFYQHYPYKSVWGPMHWGHAVSRDLVHWEYLPVALAPDTPFDRDGCFSGSAIEQDGKLVLMYTGHVTTDSQGRSDVRQTQGIAVSSDGITFAKWKDNPVLGGGQIPPEVNQRDFRDPKVFRRDGHYYAVLGSNDTRGNGLVLLYKSDNLVEWSFVNILAASDGRFGDNWECPDLFPLGGKDVFMLSPQRMPAQGEAYRNLHSTMAMIGQFDPAEGRFHAERHAPVDHGFDFYAPQSTLDDKGRRIVIGWMDMWETEMPTERLGHGWAGAMSLPREAVLKDGRIVYRPLEEIEQHRAAEFSLPAFLLDGELGIGAGGDSYELQLEFEVQDAREFGVKLRIGAGADGGAGSEAGSESRAGSGNGSEETVLAYEPGSGLLRFNRDRSGIGPGGERRAAVALANGKLALRIFVDKSSVEVFAGDGEVVMTGRIYPGKDSLGLSLFSDGACTVSVCRKWDIR